jgi:hypothetical protein
MDSDDDTESVGDETRSTAKELNYVPVVPPKANRKIPLELYT